MITKNRIRLLADAVTSAEVEPTVVTFQQRSMCVQVTSEFFDAVVEALAEVTGNDERRALEENLAEETRRRHLAEASVRLLEGQLASFRQLIAPKVAPKYTDMED